MSRKSVGNAGEDDAARMLAAKGFRIVDRNVRPLPGLSRGELDIIAWERDILCFVEVKTRRSMRVQAAENITLAKQRQLVTLAEAWLDQHEAETANAQVRFDVVCVYADPRFPAPRLELMRDAFRPE